MATGALQNRLGDARAGVPTPHELIEQLMDRNGDAIGYMACKADVSLGAEAADTIRMTVQLLSLDDADIAIATTVRVRLFKDASGFERALAAEYTASVAAPTVAVSGDGSGDLVCTSDGGGEILVDLDDVVGASDASIWVLITAAPGGHAATCPVVPSLTEVVFDDA